MRDKYHVHYCTGFRRTSSFRNAMKKATAYYLILAMLAITVLPPSIVVQSRVKTIRFGLGKKVTVEKGKSIKLRPLIKPTRAKRLVKWRSKNKRIATVSNGRVMGKRIGTTRVVASIGKKKAECKIVVREGTNISKKVPDEVVVPKETNTPTPILQLEPDPTIEPSIAPSIVPTIEPSVVPSQHPPIWPISPPEGISYFTLDSYDEFKTWISEEESKVMEDGAYCVLIETFQTCGYILLPSFHSGEDGKVLVDSSVDFVNFSFDKPGVRVTVESIDVEENADFDISDIAQFTNDKYGYEFNKMLEIEKDPLLWGHDYNRRYVREVNLKTGNGTRKSVLSTRYGIKSPTYNRFSFIEEGMLVDIIYYGDEESIDLKELETLTFEKVWLN